MESQTLSQLTVRVQIEWLDRCRIKEVRVALERGQLEMAIKLAKNIAEAAPPIGSGIWQKLRKLTTNPSLAQQEADDARAFLKYVADMGREMTSIESLLGDLKRDRLANEDQLRDKQEV